MNVTADIPHNPIELHPALGTAGFLSEARRVWKLRHNRRNGRLRQNAHTRVLLKEHSDGLQLAEYLAKQSVCVKVSGIDHASLP